MNSSLVQAARDKRLLLFIGAGVSQSLNLPSYRQLIQKMACDLDFDPEIFETHGDFLQLAEYYEITNKSIEGLRIALNKEWHQGIEIGESQIHRFIVELGAPLIYTTNYDTWIERSFDFHKQKYHKITTVKDLSTATATVTQIIKLHGDLEDASSIVLSETSFFDRLNFESPLDIKLRSDLLGHSVLFLGYSLQDINMRLMLHLLVKQWSGFEDHRPISHIFLARPNPVQESVLRSRGVEPIVASTDDPSEGLQNFLEHLVQEVKGEM